jgi:CheY-like chemotaxis protein
MAGHSAEVVRLRGMCAGLTVLVVDDDAACRDAFRSLLEELGSRVLVSADGIEALGVLRKHDPALMLCDLMMPRLDGYGLARQVRADPARRHVAIIAVSASIADVRHHLALHAHGIDAALGKPFDYRDLDRAIRSLASKRPGLFTRQRRWLRAQAAAERARARHIRQRARVLFEWAAQRDAA